MADIKTIGINTIVAILTSLVVLGGINVFADDSVYYCESRSIVMPCDHFSDSQLRCYPDKLSTKGYRDCSEGWLKVENEKSATYINEINNLEFNNKQITSSRGKYPRYTNGVPKMINNTQYLCDEYKEGWMCEQADILFLKSLDNTSVIFIEKTPNSK